MIKKQKTKNKKNKQKANIQKTIKNVFDDFEDKRTIVKIKGEITDVDFDNYEDKNPKIKAEVKDVIFEDVEPKFIKNVIKTVKDKDLKITK